MNKSIKIDKAGKKSKNKIADAARLKKRLKYFKASADIKPDESKIVAVIEKSKLAYCEGAERRTSSRFEFVCSQTRYIKKSWWFIQPLILCMAWQSACLINDTSVTIRCMGVFAALFVITAFPELWKNRSSKSIEIELCAYYSLKQIYTARLIAFAAVDSLLLGIFAGGMLLAAVVPIGRLAVEFFLPMAVTACICMRTLRSRVITSEYAAVCLSLLWSAAWCLLISNNDIYSRITPQIWTGVSAIISAYLIYAVRRVVCECDDRAEPIII